MLLIGCKSSIGPLRGELFILQSIAGIPLPAPYAENPNLSLRIIADTIALTTYYEGERHTRVETDNGGTRMDYETFSFVRNGDRIEITFPCPPNALCVKPPHLAGTLTTESLVVDHSVISREPLVYRRMAILEQRMGMTCTLKRVGAADIDKISKSPEAASAMIDDNADRDFPLEEVRMPGCLGLLLRLTPIKVTQVAERPKGAPSPEIIDDPDRMDLEVWDVMNYFLTGTATEGELPGGFLVNGGKEMSTEDDEAQLRLLTPSDVEEIDRHLQSLSRDDLRARINIPLMINQRLVSKPKEKGAPEETMEYLEHVLDELDTLKVFVAGTRGKSAGLLVMLN